MTRGKAEDAGGLTPAKDDNAALYHFDRRTLPIFKCVDYKSLFNISACADWRDRFFALQGKKPQQS